MWDGISSLTQRLTSRTTSQALETLELWSVPKCERSGTSCGESRRNEGRVILHVWEEAELSAGQTWVTGRSPGDSPEALLALPPFIRRMLNCSYECSCSRRSELP